MDGIPMGDLPTEARAACVRLRDGLLPMLGGDLVAIWTYGAATLPEPPARLGDVDAHVVLARAAPPETAARIDGLHKRIESERGVDLDAWYILLDDARRPEPPGHLLAPGMVDDSWALHRAHLLSPRHSVVYGAAPEGIVRPPAWIEVEGALRHDLGYIATNLHRMETEPYAPYAVLNCCRIAHTFATREPVVSKGESAVWAFASLSAGWRGLIEAAGRWYDRTERPGDERILREQTPPFVEYVKARVSRRGL